NWYPKEEMGNQSSARRTSLRERVTSMAQSGKDDVLEDSSRLMPDMFEISLSGHHGLPSQPNLMCFVPQYELLAVAAGSQHIKLYGREGIERFVLCASVAQGSLGAVASFLQCTSNDRLIFVSSDSGVQVIDLKHLQDEKQVVIAQLPPSWTTCRITAVETIKAQKSASFFFLALDDGSIRVVEEETCEFSTYEINLSDVDLQETKDMTINAMASNPADANQLLIAYDSILIVWDIAKQKATFKTTATSSVSSVAWHLSGKRFAAGLTDGSFAIYRTDKQQSMVFPLEKDPIVRLNWYTNDVTSPGILMTAQGSTVNLMYCPSNLSPKEAMSEMAKANFQWQTTKLSIPSTVMDVVWTSHVDKMETACAPFTCIVLAGDPMGGIFPMIHLYPVPCTVLASKDEFIWHDANSARLSLTELDQISCMQIINLSGSNGALRDDLFATFENGQPQDQVLGWTNPLRGGTLEIIHSSLSQEICQNLSPSDFKRVTLLVTGHASKVNICELLPRANGIGTGHLSLLHSVCLDQAELTSMDITCLHFCPQSKLLLVGMVSGEVAVFSFQESFQFVFSLHVHSNAIEKIALCASAGYVVLSDTFGVVSIIHLDSQEYKLAIFDISGDDPISVNSLAIHCNNLYVGRGNGQVELYDLYSADLLQSYSISDSAPEAISHLALLQENGCQVQQSLHLNEILEKNSQDNASDEIVLRIGELLKASSIPKLLVDPESLVTVELPTGPLGIFLQDENLERVVVNAFVPGDENARIMQTHGIQPNYTLVGINGNDITSIPKNDVVDLIAMLNEKTKQLTFTKPAEQPYVLCTKGRSVAIFCTSKPPTDPSRGNFKQCVDVDSLIELRSSIVAITSCSIPIDDKLETAFIVFDDSGYVYVLAIPSLRVVWSASLPSTFQSGYAFECTYAEISSNTGEIVLSISGGDLLRYSIFSPAISTELSMLQWMTSKIDFQSHEMEWMEKEDVVMERKNSGFFNLFTSTKDVFIMPSKETVERQKLLGDRPNKANQSTPQAGLGATMNALNEASQNLHLRGEKLADLGEKTEALKRNADEFYQTMKAFNQKQAKKKWRISYFEGFAPQLLFKVRFILEAPGMGHTWSSTKDEYYVGSTSPYTMNSFSSGTLSHDRKTDVIYDVHDGQEILVIGSRTCLPLLEAKGKKTKQTDLLKRLGLVVHTSGSRLTRSALVVITDLLRLDGNKLVPRNKTWGNIPTNWPSTSIKGPAEASGALRIGDIIYSINGVKVVNKTRSQVMKLIAEQSSHPLVLTFRHGEGVAPVQWENEYCFDPPEGEYKEPENEWGAAQPPKIGGSVSI
ncbi:hypothetical protein THRCLA_02677, partial [Thraustotheca clavata]